MEAFFNWSGWIFGVIGIIFGIIQLLEKNKYKKKYQNIITSNDNNTTESITADRGGIAVKENKGGIHVKR